MKDCEISISILIVYPYYLAYLLSIEEWAIERIALCVSCLEVEREGAS